MYNMDISIFGYKINLWVIILIIVLYIILVSHTFCSCCNFYNIIEGLEAMKTDDKGNQRRDLPAKIAGDISDSLKPLVGKEGFTGANTNYGQSSPYDLNDTKPIDTSSWNAADLSIVPGRQPSAGAQSILNRPQQPVPLPEGEMLMFANTEFKPECCPNTYSISSGCACMTTEQYNYLIKRGGNNVPYSEY